MDVNFNSFKRKINTLYSKKKINTYYLLGNRSINSVMASFRTKCSQLKDNLFQNGIIESNLCSCGNAETIYYYFLNAKILLSKETSSLQKPYLFLVCHWPLFFMEILTSLITKISYFLMRC